MIKLRLLWSTVLQPGCTEHFVLDWSCQKRGAMQEVHKLLLTEKKICSFRLYLYTVVSKSAFTEAYNSQNTPSPSPCHNRSAQVFLCAGFYRSERLFFFFAQLKDCHFKIKSLLFPLRESWRKTFTDLPFVIFRFVWSKRRK